jgi:signal transduction histidine kinase
VKEHRPLVLAVAAGVGGTLLVLLIPVARFAYDNTALHLALETSEGLIAAFLAFLAVHRYRASGRLQHLILGWVFSTLAFVNLVMSAGPLVSGSRPGEWLTWATVGLRLAVAVAFAAAAVAGRRDGPPRRALARTLVGATLGVAAVVAVAATAADALLGPPVDPARAPGGGTHPWVVGNPTVLVVQLLGVVLYAVAAERFTRQARATDDELLRFLGAGAVLSACSRLHYFLFPSLYSNYVYSGDVLRLGAYLFFLFGAAREIELYWRDQTRLAALEERRKLARELHDGLAQELSFIRSQTAAMAEGTRVPGIEQHLAAAAERALLESRRAVDALSDDTTTAEPLVQALRRAAEEVAARAGAIVDVRASGAPIASPAVHEALVGVAREASTNAVRHGGATALLLRVSDHGPLVRLTVADNGRGFDPVRTTWGYGLRGMQTRAQALGGELTVRSKADEGVTIEVELPHTPA